MRYLKALFVLALGLAIAAPAYAETQNVKVSGSIDAYWFYRHNLDLTDNNDTGSVANGFAVPGTDHAGSAQHRSESDDFAMTITQLQVNADLTDNVSTVVNLINQRDWNANAYEGNAANAANEFDVLLDLAYVQMKEIFYAPLTLTVGRQDLVFGRGFILGWNPQNPGINGTGAAGTGTISATEFTQIQSFDALRATLDFNPWTIDMVYSNVDENSRDNADDRELYLVNVNYKFAEYNAVAEAYYLGDFDKAAVAGATGTKDNTTHTWGGRLQFDPISQITLGGEIAYQNGDYFALVGSPARDRSAWALDLFGEYRFDNQWKPMAGIEYVYFSGEEDMGTGSTQGYGSWNGSWRLPVYGWLRDYQGIYYATGQTTDQPAGTNQEHISLYGTLNPLADLKLAANYWHFWAPESVHVTPGALGSSTLGKQIGDEIDTTVTYSYTEDVTFTFYANWFFPGSMYNSPNDSTATEYISEVKVVF